MSEVGYTFTPFALPEGTYRVWFRTDNTAPRRDRERASGSASIRSSRQSSGSSAATARRKSTADDDNFYSAGVGFQNGFIFIPQDTWGVGYAQMDLASGENEHLTEGYYNFHLTERLRLSFHLTHVLDGPDGGQQVRIPAAGRPVPGGFLGRQRLSGVRVMSNSRRRVIAGARSSPRCSAALAAGLAGAGRQDHRPDDRSS